MSLGVFVYPEICDEGQVDWVARFPEVDFLEHCIGVGDTPEEAIKEAYAALGAVMTAYSMDKSKDKPIFMPINMKDLDNQLANVKKKLAFA